MAKPEYAVFGDRGGSHQLIETSLDGEDSMLDELRFLVDRPAGHVGAEVVWSPYWGCGPLGSWWVLWRGEEDHDASRRNMVRSRAVLVRQEMLGSIGTLVDLFDGLSFDGVAAEDLPMSEVSSALARVGRPVVIPGISTAPRLLVALWPRLWPAARQRLSLRTLFGSEGIEPGRPPEIVVIPPELSPRWRTWHVVGDTGGQPDSLGGSWLRGGKVPHLERLLRANWTRLPGDLGVLARLERIARATGTLYQNTGSVADALLIVRTIEAFSAEIELPAEDLALLVAHVSEMRGATVTDIRTASLVKLAIVGDAVSASEQAISRWVCENLPNEEDEDALWIIENQAHGQHVAWWVRAVRDGLSESLADLTSDWASALWRWWSVNPCAVDWTQALLHGDSGTEASLLTEAPSGLDPKVRTRLLTLFTEFQWAKLVARLVRDVGPLEKAIKALRTRISEPEPGLEVLLETRTKKEVIEAAISTPWGPLVDHAARVTSGDPSMLDAMPSDAPGTIAILAAHLRAGGGLPSGGFNQELIHRVFDGCLRRHEVCHEIVERLGRHAGAVALTYQNLDTLSDAVDSTTRYALLAGAAAAWWQRFVADGEVVNPSEALRGAIRHRARATLRRGPIHHVVSFLALFPEVSETEVVEWLTDQTFQWRKGDTEQLGRLLLEREWTEATKSFRHSPRNELRMVAWHARSLLGRWFQVWGIAPFANDMDLALESERQSGNASLKILFLAANPPTSSSLRIDEEAREIEAKLASAKFRDSVSFCSKWATRPSDLQKALLEERPVAVHFSGHGAGMPGIVLHSEDGVDVNLVPSAALAKLFRTLRDNIRLVVLNACYSEEQANAIVREIDFVVGMSDSIGDEGARVFAAALYQGLAYGRSVQTAFDLGLNALQLKSLTDDERVPVLLVRAGIDAATGTLLSSRRFPRHGMPMSEPLA